MSAFDHYKRGDKPGPTELDLPLAKDEIVFTADQKHRTREFGDWQSRKGGFGTESFYHAPRTFVGFGVLGCGEVIVGCFEKAALRVVGWLAEVQTR